MKKSVFLRSPGSAFAFATENVRGRLGTMYLLIIAGNVCSYAVPYFLKIIVDRITSGSATTYVFSDFAPALIFTSLVIIGQEVFYRLAHITERSFVTVAYDRLTSALYQTLLQRPSAYFEERFSGELSRRIEQIGTSLRFFTDYLPWDLGWTVVATIMTAILLRIADPMLMYIFFGWLVLFLATSYLALREMLKHTEAAAEKQGELSGTIVDVLGNVSLVQAFAAQQHEYAHYRRFMDTAITTEKRERLWGIVNKFQQGTSIAALTIALIIASVYLFVRGEITVGDFVLVSAAIPTFTAIIWSFGEIVLRALRTYGEMKNALEALRSEAEPIREGLKTLIVKEPSIEFKNVSFLYPNSEEKVLADFSLSIKPGEKVGFVGRSGAGKSTVVRLLLHSYDTESGTILIGGENITDVSLESLRRAIAFVPQDTSLFHRTLYENILYARPDASRDEVIEASKRAHAHDFIEEFPDDYDTLVGERGIKLSGGQRQRIAIARAILKNAPILVLDEATSALDSESEGVVQEGLHTLFANRTVIAIAHRLSTLRSMDRIIVLENGRIAEDGAPNDLLAQKTGIFKEMWEHQKKGFI